MIGRRGFITGLISLVAAPAIVRAGSLMPVKAVLIEGPRNFLALISAEPCLLDMLDMDAVMSEVIRIYAVPQRWLR